MATVAHVVESLAGNDGITITRIRADGFVDATAMCKSGGKKWATYRQNRSTVSFLAALSEQLQTPLTNLIASQRGGAHEGTWIDPRVATHLAAWISPVFAAKVSEWLESAKRRIPVIRAEYVEAINNLRPDPTTQAERRIRDRMVLELGGAIEVPGEHGDIDVVTADEVIEIKRAPKYAHALGQVLCHSVSFPSLRRRVHLFGTNEECSDELIQKAVDVCSVHDVKVTFETIL